jgi:hypothetical protein
MMTLIIKIMRFVKQQQNYIRIDFIGILLLSVSCSPRKGTYSVCQELLTGLAGTSVWLMKMGKIQYKRLFIGIFLSLIIVLAIGTSS